MPGVLKGVGRRLLSPSQRAALRMCLNEVTIASYHRAGLRQIKKRALTRPAKLNLGSGPHTKNGFLNVDLFPGADLTLDLRQGLPFASGCCDLIFSEHFFEHIDYPEPITHLLADCFRVLAPGGTLSFSVPDTEWPLVEYSSPAGGAYFQACLEHGWHPDTCTTRLEHINYHFRQSGEHLYAYDFETAAKLLRHVGFVDVTRRPFDPSLDSEHRRVGSLFISARKPATPQR